MIEFGHLSHVGLRRELAQFHQALFARNFVGDQIRQMLCQGGRLGGALQSAGYGDQTKWTCHCCSHARWPGFNAGAGCGDHAVRGEVMAMTASQNANEQWERMIWSQINEVKWFYLTIT